MALSIDEEKCTIEISSLGHTIQFQPSEKQYQALKAETSKAVNHFYGQFCDAQIDHDQQRFTDFNYFCKYLLPSYFDYAERLSAVGIKILEPYKVPTDPHPYLSEQLRPHQEKFADSVEMVFSDVFRDLDEYTWKHYHSSIQFPTFGFRGYGSGISGALKNSAMNFGAAMLSSLGQAFIDQARQRDIMEQLQYLFFKKYQAPLKITDYFEIYLECLLPILDRFLIDCHVLVPAATSQQEFQSLSKDAYSANEAYFNRSTGVQDDSLRDKAVILWLDLISKLPNNVNSYAQISKLHRSDEQVQTDLLALSAYFGVKNEYQNRLMLDLRQQLKPILFMPENTASELRAKLEAINDFVRANPKIKSDPAVNIDEKVQALKTAIQRKENLASSASSGCFITSAVCHTLGRADDCYELTTFRSFRDNWLAKQPDGQTLIQEYYQVAPAIVTRIDQSDNSKEIYQSVWDIYLLSCMRHIEAQQFKACKNIYITMVNNLKQEYLKEEL